MSRKDRYQNANSQNAYIHGSCTQCEAIRGFYMPVAERRAYNDFWLAENVSTSSFVSLMLYAVDAQVAIATSSLKSLSFTIILTGGVPAGVDVYIYSPVRLLPRKNKLVWNYSPVKLNWFRITPPVNINWFEITPSGVKLLPHCTVVCRPRQAICPWNSWIAQGRVTDPTAASTPSPTQSASCSTLTPQRFGIHLVRNSGIICLVHCQCTLHQVSPRENDRACASNSSDWDLTVWL